jgi:hypothetical protein
MYYFFVLLFKLLSKQINIIMKKIILSLVFSSLCLLGMSQKAQIDLPITWDDTANVDYSVIGFGNDTAYLAADPTNASNIVLEVVKPSGIATQTWAGVVLGSDSLASAIPFSAGNSSLIARVYSSAIGIPMRMKVENESNAGIFVETEVLTTAVGWDTLTFDFSNQVTGTPPINFSNTYDKIAFFPNFGVVPAATETYYIDYVAIGGTSSGPMKAQIDLPITWDDTANVNYTVIDFGGNISSVVVDPTNASNLVLKTDKPSSAQSWAGTSLGGYLGTAIPFSASNTEMKARIWSVASGIPVLMKVEDQTNPAIFVETLDTTTTIGWDTLTFDFNNPSPNNQALNFSNTYDKASLFFNFNVVPASTETYYTDDVWFTGAATGPSLAQIDLPITWDDTSNVNYTVTPFGGNVTALVVDPTNASNMVLEIVKPTSAQTWAGTTLGTPDLAMAIPFAASNTILQARVWSAAAGIPVLMKVEDQTDNTIFVESLTSTSRIGWDTLTFDFSNQVPNTPALNFANTYDVVSLFMNFNVAPATNETYYADGVWFGTNTPPPTLSQINLPITWDDTTNVDYTVTPFGGNVSTSVTDPTNASNVVLEIVKPTSAQTWAGTTLGTSALATAIPFSANNTIIQAKVWSAAGGIPVLLKVEDQTDNTIFVESLVSTTKVGWDTLTFDFSNQVPNTPALNFANTYDVVSIFMNFNVAPTSNETYYVDNVSFGPLLTGGEEIVNTPTFSVYPNPANDFVTIDASLLDVANQVIVTNAVGQIVLQTNVSAIDNILNVSNFENGVYFMILNSESGTKTSKFMVAK